MPVTRKLSVVNESFKKLGEVIKESNSENNEEIVSFEITNIQTDVRSLPNSIKVSNNMMETSGSLRNSKYNLKLIKDDSGRASILETAL